MAGKKKIEIDWSKLDGLLFYDASIYVCANELNCSHDTLERKVRQKYNITFSEYKAQKLQHTALRLKQKMINKAFEGDNTCLIFSLKNIGGWTDRVEHGFDKDKKTILLKYNLDDKEEKTESSE